MESSTGLHCLPQRSQRSFGRRRRLPRDAIVCAGDTYTRAGYAPATAALAPRAPTLGTVELSPRELTVRTRRIRTDEPRGPDLLDLVPEGFSSDSEPMYWTREGNGLAGWGEAVRIETSGADRFTKADARWQRLAAGMEIDDEVGLAGSGPVAFTSIAFADEPGSSALVVPEVTVGQRDGVRWVTTVGRHDRALRPASAIEHPGTIRYGDSRFPATSYRQAVAEAIRRMHTETDVDKVVLAHDLLAWSSEPLDHRFVLRNLARRYPECWTFAVDGLVGATPELLLHRRGGHVRSRVLAGTAWPHDGHHASDLVAELLSSDKNRGEHEHAVRSLATSLRPFCDELTVPSSPEVLRLRNVLHLTSDVSGRLDPTLAEDGNAGLLRLAEAVHPTAAVGGTPTDRAMKLIEELEDMERERYAGPVGWLDADGNGEFGIALRCARISPTSAGGSQARLFAGCGVVPDSDPDLEVAEAEAKMLPVREALEGVR